MKINIIVRAFYSNHCLIYLPFRPKPLLADLAVFRIVGVVDL